jgi:hypothetical protein
MILENLLIKYRDITGVNPAEYLEDKGNINIVKGVSAGLFVYQYPGVYIGHYLFDDKGRDALLLAKEMLAEMFHTHAAQTILGITPDYNRPAKFITRRLGFTSQGGIETEDGPCEMFTLTRKDYEVLYG